MTDKELLEHAANATGKPWKWVEDRKSNSLVPGLLHRDEVNEVDYWFPWNPLVDNAKAFELMVNLGIDIRRVTIPHAIHVHAVAYRVSVMELLWSSISKVQPDAKAATRLAIVKAAARIYDLTQEGEQMLTKQDMEDYSEVSEQPKTKERNLKDYLRNFDLLYKKYSKTDHDARIKSWLAKLNETNT